MARIEDDEAETTGAPAPARPTASARAALEKAARSLGRAPDDELAAFAAAWECGDLETAFDELRTAGEAWADTARFWYELADAAERLGRTADAEAIIDAHGV